MLCMVLSEHLVPLVISIVISFVLIIIAKKIISSKFDHVQGSQKLIGIISVIIGLTESAYLGINFGLLDFALEIITSVGVGMVLFGIALQHQLKNIVAGLGMLFSKEVNVGDIITVKEDTGTIIELHLTKTVALTDEGERLVIPNQTFSEGIIKIKHKQQHRML